MSLRLERRIKIQPQKAPGGKSLPINSNPLKSGLRTFSAARRMSPRPFALPLGSFRLRFACFLSLPEGNSSVYLLFSFCCLAMALPGFDLSWISVIYRVLLFPQSLFSSYVTPNFYYDTNHS